MNLNKKRVLVTGGTGMIGTEVVDQLIQKGALVKVASIEEESGLSPDIEYERIDLRDFESCKRICNNIDVVFLSP